MTFYCYSNEYTQLDLGKFILSLAKKFSRFDLVYKVCLIAT